MRAKMIVQLLDSHQTIKNTNFGTGFHKGFKGHQKFKAKRDKNVSLTL